MADRHGEPCAPRTIVAIALAAGTLLGGVDEHVPWPIGRAPTQGELADQAAAADDLYLLEREEEYLEATERGEDSEHIFVRQEDIDAGVYTLERLFQFGDSTFEHEFRPSDGYGAQLDARLGRVHVGARGGLDTFSCAGCHSVSGPNGAGSSTESSLLLGDGVHASSALVRNPPLVLGLGVVQALGAEMTFELQQQRDVGLAEAASAGADVNVALTSKGVSFGTIVARSDGSIDATNVQGVSADLVVRPFGWKGDVARLRRFVEGAARIHFGIQAHTLALEHQKTPDPERLGFGPWYDPDGDGKQRELEEGTLTAVGLYLALLEVPVVLPPHDPALRDMWAHGSTVFDELGCSGCHKRSLQLQLPTWREMPDTTGGAGIEINLFTDGEQPRGTHQVELLSDLKRHDMGPELADAFDGEDGIGASEFMTRRLWGLAESAPYLHDGRAATIHDAIGFHGGEAAAARSAYGAASTEDRRDLHVFLLSLTRTPKVRVQR